jgi:hypothetical protein
MLFLRSVLLSLIMVWDGLIRKPLLLNIEIDSNALVSQSHGVAQEPLASIPLQLDRLQCYVAVLQHLLRCALSETSACNVLNLKTDRLHTDQSKFP